MGHYKSNVRDLEFNMFEVLRMNEALDAGEFGDMDTETAKGILSEVATLTEGPVAESFASADRNPPVFDPETHSVSIPEDFKKSFKAWYDAGYWSMGLPEELGGM
ncbi:MAG: acyl-CoA dehydrogenase family protein, partial [Dietzia sp.]|nr:acyl-CoA dehydrogenase family protein [Dietzia sp.]